MSLYQLLAEADSNGGTYVVHWLPSRKAVLEGGQE